MCESGCGSGCDLGGSVSGSRSRGWTWFFLGGGCPYLRIVIRCKILVRLVKVNGTDVEMPSFWVRRMGVNHGMSID